jgi:hypothetical protein
MCANTFRRLSPSGGVPASRTNYPRSQITMDRYAPIAGGYTAGHPEHSRPASRAEAGLAEKDDDELIGAARDVYRKLQRTPRWSNDNDALIREWGAVCAEMNRRGITDDVTEGAGVPRP